jgi:hypothetical protein
MKEKKTVNAAHVIRGLFIRGFAYSWSKCQKFTICVPSLAYLQFIEDFNEVKVTFLQAYRASSFIPF